MKLGSNNPTDILLGSTSISAAYLGATQVWPLGGSSTVNISVGAISGGQPEGTYSITESVTTTGPAQIIVLTAIVSGITSGVLVDGNAASVIYSPTNQDDKYVSAYSYNVTGAGTYSVESYHALGPLESCMSVYVVEGATAPTFSLENWNTARTVASDGGIIWFQQTINSTPVTPSATNALTVDHNADIRTGEWNYSAHYNGSNTVTPGTDPGASQVFFTLLFEAA